MINARPPNVLPAPFSIDFKRSEGCIPSNKPAVTATIRSDKKGLTFFAVKNTCSAIAAMMIRNVIGYFLPAFVNEYSNRWFFLIQ
jgi:hypothetical protein